MLKIVRIEQKHVKQVCALLYEMHSSMRTNQDNQNKSIAFCKDKVYKKVTDGINNKFVFSRIVINEDNEIVGILAGSLSTFIFSDQRMASDDVFFFKKGAGNIAVVKSLVTMFTDWAKENDAIQVRMFCGCGYKPKAFARMMRVVGFSRFMIGFSKDI